MTYLENDHCSLSNNSSENCICPETVSRKNWLFSDTPDGASAKALYLTIVEMTTTYDLNLYGYVKYLLAHHTNKNMADDNLAKLCAYGLSMLSNRSIVRTLSSLYFCATIVSTTKQSV